MKPNITKIAVIPGKRKTEMALQAALKISREIVGAKITEVIIDETPNSGDANSLYEIAVDGISGEPAGGLSDLLLAQSKPNLKDTSDSVHKGMAKFKFENAHVTRHRRKGS